MGMAASQARFLGLTARKTNVEYEGQQINQQRTALGNQTANYYNQMLGMKVPVPPAIDDYTKTVYTFEDGALKNTITSLIAQPGGLYSVSYLRQWQDDFAVVSATPSIITKDTSKTGTFTTAAAAVAGDIAATLAAIEAEIAAVMEDTTANNQTKIAAALALANARTAAAQAGANENDVITAATATTDGAFMIGASELRLLGSSPTPAEVLADPYYSSLSDADGTITEKLAALLEVERQQMAQLDTAYGPSEKGWAVRYVQNSTTGAYEPQFYNLDVITSENTIYDATTGQSQSHIPAYKVGSQQKNEEIKGVQARLEQDATGRIINITLNADQPDAVTYALATNTIADQQRYDDAMNQYEYDKFQYDQQIQEVNAKIAIIQAQDRNLELRLKQLDTEQNAIQTEMDAVTKVIQKNVESTFKTFG